MDIYKLQFLSNNYYRNSNNLILTLWFLTSRVLKYSYIDLFCKYAHIYVKYLKIYQLKEVNKNYVKYLYN